jgi:hypothetical protein
LKALAQLAHKRSVVDQLLERIETDQTLGAGWLGQIGNLTQGLSPQQTGEVVWQLARKYHAAGKGEQAAEALAHLLDKHPQHPLADAAALWLMQYYASSEVAWRQRKETKYEVQVAAATAGQVELTPAAAAAGPPVSRAGFTSLAGLSQNPKERSGRALAWSQRVESTRPLLYAEPAFRFSLATASRQAGQPRNADRLLQMLASAQPAPPGMNLFSSDLWRQNAAAEHWLLHKGQNPPKKLCSVMTAAVRPKLDGRLDDPVWQAAKAVALHSAAGEAAEHPAAAVLAFDDEFLYIAVSCRKTAGVDNSIPREAAGGARKADCDLASRDHVEIATTAASGRWPSTTAAGRRKAALATRPGTRSGTSPPAATSNSGRSKPPFRSASCAPSRRRSATPGRWAFSG